MLLVGLPETLGSWAGLGFQWVSGSEARHGGLPRRIGRRPECADVWFVVASCVSAMLITLTQVDWVVCAVVTLGRCPIRQCHPLAAQVVVEAAAEVHHALRGEFDDAGGE